jgi:ubiquinone/menaquinone biosynthesis C-methylase UbiE
LSEIVRVLKPGGDYVFSIPFENHSDGGFHTQKHTKDYWHKKLVEFFNNVEIRVTSSGNECIGRCVK